MGQATDERAPAVAGLRAAAAPPPDLAAALPLNYRATRVVRARLSGESVPEAIVSSIGPLSGPEDFHPADLQVLSWDPLARRWDTVFDAQKVESLGSFSPSTSNSPIEPFSVASPPPIMSSNGFEEDVPQVGFAKFAPGEGEDLVFTTSSNGGAGSGSGELVAVSITRGVANVAYLWAGRGGARFRVVGAAPHQALRVTSEYWTYDDADCCPLRSYAFTLSGTDAGSYLQDADDDRPFLGVYLAVKPVIGSQARVAEVVPGSPAAGILRRGDLLQSVVGAKSTKQPLLGPPVIDEVSAHHAGTEVTLQIKRGPRELEVSVRLSSILSHAAQALIPPRTYSIVVL